MQTENPGHWKASERSGEKTLQGRVDSDLVRSILQIKKGGHKKQSSSQKKGIRKRERPLKKRGTCETRFKKTSTGMSREAKKESGGVSPAREAKEALLRGEKRKEWPPD